EDPRLGRARRGSFAALRMTAHQRARRGRKMSDLKRTGRRRFLALAGTSASVLLAACSGAASPTAAPAAKPADTKPADTKPAAAEPTKPAAAGATTPAAPAPTAAAGATPAAAAPAAASTDKSIK